MTDRPVRPERCLNIGCGRRFHPQWVNLDAHPVHPSIGSHDVTTGLPFPAASFDVVYHSHLLEHLSPDKGHALLSECYRVLLPGGVIRVAVPDLETIARLYLDSLARARAGDAAWEQNYDWMLIELYDQSVRETTGGGHGSYLNRDVIPNLEFVVARQGREVEESIEGQRLLRATASAAFPSSSGSLLHTLRLQLSRIGRGAEAVRRGDWRRIREWLLRRLLQQDYDLLQLGRFRRSGELHQWMYDSFSLARALGRAGFIDPVSCDAVQSRVEGWASFELDTDASGRVCKPDSVYVEAVKPESPRIAPGHSSCASS